MKQSYTRKIRPHVFEAGLYNALFMSTLAQYGDKYEAQLRVVADTMQAGISPTEVFNISDAEELELVPTRPTLWNRLFSERSRRIAIVLVCLAIVIDVAFTLVQMTHRV